MLKAQKKDIHAIKRATQISHGTSLAEQVYQAFKRDIISGTYRPGEALSENLLGKRYATSRTPVREAAARLQRENLLRVIPKKGYFVKLISVPELNELYEYRAIIECAAAELAAQKEPDPDLLDELQRHSSVRYKAGDRNSYKRFIESDTAFHITIARLTRNHLVITTISDLRSHIERLLYAAINLGDYGTLLAREHFKICQAIKNRDAESARQLMFEHVMDSKDKILKLL